MTKKRVKLDCKGDMNTIIRDLNTKWMTKDNCNNIKTTKDLKTCFGAYSIALSVFKYRMIIFSTYTSSKKIQGPNLLFITKLVFLLIP